MNGSIRPFSALVVAAGLLGTLLLVGGCNDPKYKAKRAVRDGRIQEFLQEYSDMEAERPGNIEALKALNAEMEAHHAEQWEQTLKRIEESYLKDKHDWMIGAPSRKEKIHDILSGHPEKIPDVWGEMVY